MDYNNLTFELDRNTIAEGECVDVSWACAEPEMVSLVVEDGSQRNTYPLDDSGIKRIFLNGPKQATITLKASVGGKVYSRSAVVRITPRLKQKAERPKRERTYRARPVESWWSRMGYKLRSRWHSLRYGWSCMPERKRLAYTVLWLLLLVMMLYNISPSLLFLGLIGVVGYLMWIIFKR